MTLSSKSGGRTRVSGVNQGDLDWIANSIWGIADDVLPDLYVRGKYRDSILPMAELQRLDSVLEDGKQAVLDMKQALDAAGRRKADVEAVLPPGGRRNQVGERTCSTTAFPEPAEC